ncbi:MAG: ABC transporter ATP-binding protein [Treponema sp.]|jgi:sulfonate transport system ATP-binding protein|nr:ABC transporter ATP-binding protein [Treponema sp.]
MAVTVDNSIALSIDTVSKTFHTKIKDVQALERVSLTIRHGEFVSLIGPSGCGKTTLLRLISGLEKDYEGDILLENKRIERPGLDRGVIFQEPRLFPWLSVSANVAIGINGNKSYVQEQVDYFLKMVGLEDFGKSYPGQLSGGMQQRVAIARALITRPKVLLLDEPFGALDALTRVYMQEEVEKIWRVAKTTMILVTHDIEEAIFLGDRVIVMTARPGEIKSVINVDIPRSRDRGNPRFVEIRKNVLHTFHDTIGTYTI